MKGEELFPPHSACFSGGGGVGVGVGGGQTGSQTSDRLRKTTGSVAGWRESHTGNGWVSGRVALYRSWKCSDG